MGNVVEMMMENKNTFKGFSSELTRNGIEMYVPKNGFQAYVQFNDDIMLTEIPKRKVSKISKKFDVESSPLYRDRKRGDKVLFRIYPNRMKDVTIIPIYGYRGCRFIIVEGEELLCIINTHDNGIIRDIELCARLTQDTSKYKNISNVFIDVVEVKRKESFTIYGTTTPDTLQVVFQVTHVSEGYAYVLNKYIYNLPMSAMSDDTIRENIYSNIYDELYNSYLGEPAIGQDNI